MADEAPYTGSRSHLTAAVSSGADASTALFIAPYACTVTSVLYTTATAITGANTDTRAVSVTNKGAAGSGSTSVATLQFNAGVSTVAFVPKAVTLSGTAANLVLAAGDVLAWSSTHVGTGTADPGGLIFLAYSRNDS